MTYEAVAASVPASASARSSAEIKELVEDFLKSGEPSRKIMTELEPDGFLMVDAEALVARIKRRLIALDLAEYVWAGLRRAEHSHTRYDVFIWSVDATGLPGYTPRKE